MGGGGAEKFIVVDFSTISGNNGNISIPSFRSG